MKRRQFITLLGGTAVAWPLAARAQQAAIPVIGFLSGRSLASDAPLVDAFRRGLNESGYVEGHNVAIEFRWADGRFDRVLALASNPVDRKVGVIFAGGLDVKIREVRRAISSTPIVFATAGDPVELGLVASLNRPRSNATGVTLISAALWPKRLELLHEVTPATTIALLVNPTDPNAEPTTVDVQAAARALGLQLHVLRAGNEHDFAPAFAELLLRKDIGALLVTSNALFNNRREELVSLAALHTIPAIYDRREFPADGGLMSYGASNIDQYRQSGIYVGQILKGEKPADLPVEQPTKFELVINLKTAKALGLQIPDKLLALADEVIE